MLALIIHICGNVRVHEVVCISLGLHNERYKFTVCYSALLVRSL